MQELSPDTIAAAGQLLQAGGLVAFPTETVYGLGANAADPVAVRRIFAAKGRPADHPLIVHVEGPDALDFWARDVPPAAWRLAEHFWPGPLTLILRRGNAPLEVTGGQDTVGLRVPGHPVALALLKAFGGGVAAPSANRFGRVSPTRARHVRQELQGLVDMVLDGGPCRVGVESTIVSLAGARPVLLRPGAVALHELQEVLGEKVDAPAVDGTIRAPGMLASHYAPVTPLEVWPTEKLQQRAEELARTGLKVAVLIIHSEPCAITATPNIIPFPMPTAPENYARRLFAVLRLFDNAGLDVLLAEAAPETEAWQAVKDRMRRASRSGKS
ncbi:L-threonylcarbamoyladenylate synthase [Methylobacter sp.]|uniref:L-threonylcarbamoyladenylate synthase n=1 Tax=Methylobacter sp. TaxID=2051955 RepID=UPI0024874C7F|nr:L-threonylcarbamoyladenylate synthase [Methylobacter sp.]MDI1276963.1 L-threonylcarbamoyladenylate synthase [Methylobacter sp.]MDI1357575.1 L-threonylcarbamoyladenylate synthase [Methylobacter sp.]